MTDRVYNFSAGPATIAQSVLERVKHELLDFESTGASVMEISHRSALFGEKVLHPAKENLRKLLNIPENYQILFVSAGASHQFAMIPLNLLSCQSAKADYFYTGIWSGKAIAEAKKYADIHIAVNGENSHFTDIDPAEKWQLNTDNANYVYYTSNETINGLQFQDVPQTGAVPLIADMSSDILSKRLDVSQFGLIYAGAQKNIGPAGLTLVIIREDLIGRARSVTPTLYNYQTYADSNSLYHTPNTFGMYVAGCVFQWLLSLGGLAEIEKINARKAAKLYHLIDQTDFYRNPINPVYRSKMNVVFYLPTSELDKLFISQASLYGLINLKGHKAVGGIRASIYNAMPESGIDKLIDFMKTFEKMYG